MLDMKDFFIEDFENIDQKNYRQRTAGSHIFHSLEWMMTVKETLGISYKIAMLKHKDKIVASIPFIGYRNFIKGPCALTAMNVDYTSEGTYMTFEDGTMISYVISLSFMELEPVYNHDYNEFGEDEIGF